MNHTNNGVHRCPELVVVAQNTSRHRTVHQLSYVCNGVVVTEWAHGIDGRMDSRGFTYCPYCCCDLNEPIPNQVTIE